MFYFDVSVDQSTNQKLEMTFALKEVYVLTWTWCWRSETWWPTHRWTRSHCWKIKIQKIFFVYCTYSKFLATFPHFGNLSKLCTIYVLKFQQLYTKLLLFTFCWGYEGFLVHCWFWLHHYLYCCFFAWSCCLLCFPFYCCCLSCHLICLSIYEKMKHVCVCMSTHLK